MEHEFTSAAGRALGRTAAWLDRNDCSELSGPALLLGLLAEPECRAALRLARGGIDATAVRAHWAQLGDLEIVSICGDIPPPAAVVPFEPLLFAVGQRLADFPPPLVFATEHLLLGLVAAEDETSHWLRRQGIDGDALRNEICHMYGYDAGAALAAGQCAYQPEAPARETETLPERPSLALRAGIGPDTPPNESVAVLRILDAAANRAREGLRVTEDYVRFALDDRHLTEQLKRLRHELAEAVSPLPAGRRLSRARPRPTLARP